jgi:vacuolar-type H+-ATPase subunit I/STV1
MLSSTSEENDAVTSQQAPERRKPMEEMTKDELIAMFGKFKAHSAKLLDEKKKYLELYENCCKERDDMKMKAVSLLKRVKELEEERNSSKTLGSTEFKSTIINDTTVNKEAKINQLETDNQKYKNATQQALMKLKELKTSLELKTTSEAKAVEECLQLKSELSSIYSQQQQQQQLSSMEKKVFIFIFHK